MADKINLFTVADGFGDSQAVPSWYKAYIKWPEIIQLMTKNVNLSNFSRYGAGNEYIINCVRNNWKNHQVILIQWAVPKRLDLILAHNENYKNFWQNEIDNDPMYKDNIVQMGLDQVWISSGSKSSAVLEYHNKFITTKQHQMRSQIYIDHAKMLLENTTHGFLLTTTSNYLQDTVHDHSNLYWHDQFQGMCAFRAVSKYSELDLGLTQPIPLIHFDFIKQFIQPKLDLPWRNSVEIQAVENMLYRKYQEALPNRPQ